MENQKIIVVGISGENLPTNYLDEYLAECSTVIATASVLERFKEEYEKDSRLMQWVPIVPLARCLDAISEALCSHSVLVFTSGDPLFYGLGQTLKSRFPAKEIVFFPALSSLQLCFARFGIPWNDAAFLSLHGRSFNDLRSVLHKSKIFVLTDRENSPQKIAQHLIDNLPDSELDTYKMHVGVKLGMEGEQLHSGTVPEISNKRFDQPNCLIIQRNIGKNERPGNFGLVETEIRHSRGLITKNEVRAAVLHALRLPSNGVFWDVGAGSGSISIEAALLNPALSVFAIERKQEEIDNITCNRDRYKCWNISVCQGKAPEILKKLPAPDCVFIGGSGGSLAEIINVITHKNLKVDRIVVTGVIQDTIDTAPKLLYQAGYSVDASVVSTTRYSFPEAQSDQFNPIHIIRATRYHE